MRQGKDRAYVTGRKLPRFPKNRDQSHLRSAGMVNLQSVSFQHVAVCELTQKTLGKRSILNGVGLMLSTKRAQVRQRSAF